MLRYDPSKIWFSLVIVQPREAFFQWYNAISQRRLARSPGRIVEPYVPEENGVWIIPERGSFDLEFDHYLARLKRHIVQHELEKYGPLSSDERPGEWTEELCDRFFMLECRDGASVPDPVDLGMGMSFWNP